MYQIGFLARADWMRELGARPEKITDLDALHDLLMQVRQRRPNAEGVLPDNGQFFPFPELDPLGDTFGVLTEESGTTVVNWYAADAYSRLCRTMHQWYQEGLILRNASLRDEPATDRMRLCNSFGFFARLNRDSLDCYTRACGTELTASRWGRPFRTALSRRRAGACLRPTATAGRHWLFLNCCTRMHPATISLRREMGKRSSSIRGRICISTPADCCWKQTSSRSGSLRPMGSASTTVQLPQSWMPAGH